MFCCASPASIYFSVINFFLYTYCFARSQNVFCVSPASIFFSVINFFLYTHLHCTVATAYQPARSSRTLPRRHVRVAHVSFNNKRLSIYDDPRFWEIITAVQDWNATSAHVEAFGPELVHSYLVHNRKSISPVQAGLRCQACVPFNARAAAYAHAISPSFQKSFLKTLNLI